MKPKLYKEAKELQDNIDTCDFIIKGISGVNRINFNKFNKDGDYCGGIILGIGNELFQDINKELIELLKTTVLKFIRDKKIDFQMKFDKI